MIRRCRALAWVWLSSLTGCVSTPHFADSASTPSQQKHRQAILGAYNQYKGTPYRLSGNNKSGIDCSAFVQRVFQQAFQQSLPRTTSKQSYAGIAASPSHLAIGDLVFFKTGLQTRHVGIYLGQGQFVHASTSKGVMRSSLYSPYWSDAFWMARRLL